MYYTKAKFHGAEVKIGINDESVFTLCAECGKQMMVDIVDEIRCNRDFDLYGTGQFCNQECADRYFSNPMWKSV